MVLIRLIQTTETEEAYSLDLPRFPIFLSVVDLGLFETLLIRVFLLSLS